MNKKYSGIQILRFIAASFVVIDHSFVTVVRNWSDMEQPIQAAHTFGDVGVIVFFGISGFIMVTTRYESFGSIKKSIDFMFSRILRILPIYAIATTLQYFNKMNSGGEYNFVNYLKSLLFIPYIGTGGHFRPILGQGWTLNYEMFFYLVFALSLCLTRIKGIFLSIVFLLIVVGFNGENLGDNKVFSFYMNHILLYFICGMLVALATKHFDIKISNFLLPMLFVVLLMVVSVALKLVTTVNFFLFLSLIFVFVCVYVSATCRSSNQSGMFQTMLEHLGDASYSTYLFHGFFIGAAKIISTKINEPQYGVALIFVVFCILGSNLTGLFVYRFVELPVTNFSNRHYRKLKGSN